MSVIRENIKTLESSTKKWLLVLFFAAFLGGGVLAQEKYLDADAGFGEGNAAQTASRPSQGNRSLSNIGSGIMFDASRSRRTDDGRFWSQIYTGPWGFVDAGSFELSVGFVLGRIARQNRWCFPLLAMNVSLIWQVPAAAMGIVPLLGIGLDTVVWARHECLRSDYTLDTFPGHPIREFSSLKFKFGAGRDFDLSENRFFRTRLLGYYGRRFGGNPNPWGGTLRLGVAERC